MTKHSLIDKEKVLGRATSSLLCIIAVISIMSCSSHRKVVMEMSREDMVDTIQITAQLKKRKPTGKGVLVFQPMREGETTADIKYAYEWKSEGADVFIVEFPHVDNPLERKSSVTLMSRVETYISVREHLEKEQGINHWTYLSLGLALPWAIETALNIPPDRMVVYRATDQSPLDNRRLLMQGDTMSTEEEWQPVDDYMDTQEAWQMLIENVESQNYSGVFTFDGLPDKLWGEWHNYPFQENLSVLQCPIVWIMQKNDPRVSKTFFNLMKDIQNAYENRSVQLYDAEKDDALLKRLQSIVREN